MPSRRFTISFGSRLLTALNHPHPVIELAGLNGYMELTTERDLIKGVAKRWFKTYESTMDSMPSLFGCNSKTKREISSQLQRLDKETATAQDVADIIGNCSWTRLTCDGCGDDVTALLSVGQPRDYESNTADLCEACVNKASAIKWD